MGNPPVDGSGEVAVEGTEGGAVEGAVVDDVGDGTGDGTGEGFNFDYSEEDDDGADALSFESPDAPATEKPTSPDAPATEKLTSNISKSQSLNVSKKMKPPTQSIGKGPDYMKRLAEEEKKRKKEKKEKKEKNEKKEKKEKGMKRKQEAPEVIDLTHEESYQKIKNATDWKFEDDDEQVNLESNVENMEEEKKNVIIIQCYNLLRKLHGTKTTAEPPKKKVARKSHGKGENHLQIFVLYSRNSHLPTVDITFHQEKLQLILTIATMTAIMRVPIVVVMTTYPVKVARTVMMKVAMVAMKVKSTMKMKSTKRAKTAVLQKKNSPMRKTKKKMTIMMMPTLESKNLALVMAVFQP